MRKIRCFARGLLTLRPRLVQLGVSPIYHMREVAKNKHQALWIEAVDAKFEGIGARWKRDDFERILAGFDVRLESLQCIPPEL